MKILFLTQFFWPEQRTAPTNLGALAEDLAARGHEVVVVTGVPNHPFGRVYDGYAMKAFQWEDARGFRILRVPLIPDHSGSPVRRLANYGSFTATASTVGAWLTRRFHADVVFAYLAPLTMGFTASVLRRVQGAPVVYWVTDLWPENLRATGAPIGPNGYRALRWIEDRTYRHAAAICVDAPAFETNLVAKGVPRHKIHAVAEWADEGLFFPVERDPALAEAFGLGEGFTVMYGGNLGPAQHLETVLDAADLVRDLEDVRFVFIGDGTDADALRGRAADLPNVRFLPRQPLEAMRGFFAWADVLLIHLQASPIFSLQLPSKVLAYMACGRPVLAAVPGSVSQIVQEADAGLTCGSEDPEAIAALVRRFRAMPSAERERLGANGVTAHRTSYSRAVQVDRLESILIGVAGRARAASAP
jgi:putative colanic acid biosynthesis glycosyltransferase WcaI